MKRNNKAVSLMGGIEAAIKVTGVSLIMTAAFLSASVPVYGSAGAGNVISGIGSNTGTSTSTSTSASTGTGTKTTASSTGGTGSSVATSDQTTDSEDQDSTKSDADNTLQGVKENAKKEITGYAAIKKVGQSKETAEAIDKLVKKYSKTIGTANGDTNHDGLATKSTVNSCVTTAKEAIDELLPDKDDDDSVKSNETESNLPSSTSDFIMVGGDWVTPVVSYGQCVNIVLPVVNMSQINLTDVTVTPVISNSVNEWPFVVETSNYTQTIPDLPGKGNGQNDYDRRRELTWTLKTRADALDGYYRLQFNVLYSNEAEIESCTLTTYCKVIGAPGSGNIETDGGSLSTPRVIVTGYETEPAKVHAGDTFTLTLHLLNTSKRTAVSNMLVNLSAPSEGTDSDSSYAVFLPTSGSNTEYVASIGKGSATDLVIEMTAKADLSQKPYQLDVSMEYEDEDYASYTATADVSIPVYQDARFELGKPEIMPAELMQGSESNVMFSIYNLGKVTLYNVKVSFEGDAISGGETYLGKIEAGSTGNVDVMVTGEKPTAEGETDYIVITYEDEAGNQSEYKEELQLKVKGDGMSSGGTDSVGGDTQGFDVFEDEELDYLEYEEGSGAKKWIIIGLIALVVIAGITFAVIAVGKARKKKREKEDLNLLEELDGKEDENETP